jgi:hypothetical protein
MPIPRARDDNIPPPLPPPRIISAIQEGHDVGWQWGNTQNNHFGGVKPDSSLFGSQAPSAPPSRSTENKSPDSFDGHTDEDSARRSTVDAYVSSQRIPFIRLTVDT